MLLLCSETLKSFTKFYPGRHREYKEKSHSIISHGEEEAPNLRKHLYI